MGKPSSLVAAPSDAKDPTLPDGTEAASALRRLRAVSGNGARLRRRRRYCGGRRRPSTRTAAGATTRSRRAAERVVGQGGVDTCFNGGEGSCVRDQDRSDESRRALAALLRCDSLPRRLRAPFPSSPEHDYAVSPE